MRKKLSLFVFIDAFGWELLRDHPFLDDVLVTKAPLETIFGYSSSCDPSIITGKLPQQHGHFSFFYYNPEKSPFGLCRLLSFLPKFVTRRGRVRRLLSRFIQRLYGFTGYFQIYNMPFKHLPLFDYSEKRDIYEKGGINSGDETIFDHLREQGIRYHFSDWRLSEEHNLAALEEALRAADVELAYLYMASMDAILHEHGTVSPHVTRKIGWYEEQVRKLLALAEERYDEVQLYVFSDHGMTDVTESCDLMRPIGELGLRFGVDYAAVYDSTMARFWFLEESSRQPIVEVLEREPRGDILSEEQLEAYGCNFADRKYGELFFLMKPGVLINPSFMGEVQLGGMHGYRPDHEGSVAMFAASVEVDPLPRDLRDLYTLMRREVPPS